MTDTVTESTVWPVNEQGEIILAKGTGTDTVVGYLPTPLLPVDNDQKVSVKFPDFGIILPTEWFAAALLNSWVNVPTFVPTQYRKLGDEVQVIMAVAGGTTSPIFRLPIGFRPTASVSLPVQVHDNTNAPDYGHLRIASDGYVHLEHPGSLNNHKAYATFSFWIF